MAERKQNRDFECSRKPRKFSPRYLRLHTRVSGEGVQEPMSEPIDNKMCPYSAPRGYSEDLPGGKPVRKRCPVCGRRIITDSGPGFPPHKKKEWYKKKKKGC